MNFLKYNHKHSESILLMTFVLFFSLVISFMILIVVLNEPVIEPAKITTPLIKLYPNNSYVAKTN